MTDRTAGPKIVDFSSHLSGPMASYLLRELGADVIKVENPKSGDGLRWGKPYIAGTGKFHASLNAGARSLAVSTRSPHWPEVVAACARWADAVIVGARPEDALTRGIDFGSLRQIRRDVVYCSITGYGDRGPWSHKAAHGQNADAMAGNVPVDWVDGLPLTPEGWRSAGTTLAGVFAALGIMGALYRREIEGGAYFVPVSMWESAVWWNWRDVNQFANNGHGSTEYATLGSRYSMYPTGDDRAIIVCPLEEKFWLRFCDALSLPDEWRTRGSWATTKSDYGYDDERPAIVAAMRRKPLQEWIDIFDAADMPFAPVLTVDEAIQTDHAAANDVLRTISVSGQLGKVARAPYRVLDSPEADRAEPPAVPPGLGEHNRDLLEELGLPDLGDELGAR